MSSPAAAQRSAAEAEKVQKAAERAGMISSISSDLKEALVAVDLISEGISMTASGDGGLELVIVELWTDATPKLTAAALSLATLSGRQKYASHVAAIGRRAVEAAIDIIALTPSNSVETYEPRAEPSLAAAVFTKDLQTTIDTEWPSDLEEPLSQIPRNATMSAVDRESRNAMFYHWPIDLSAGKLAMLIASKLLEETIIRLDVYAASIAAQRAPEGYIFLEDAAAAFFALRNLGRTAMFIAQAANREGAGVIPGAVSAVEYEDAAQATCHGLRLLAVRSFDLYKKQFPDGKIPGWVNPLPTAKIINSNDFNRALVEARSSEFFRPKTPPKPGAAPGHPSAGPSV